MSDRLSGFHSDRMLVVVDEALPVPLLPIWAWRRLAALPSPGRVRWWSLERGRLRRRWAEPLPRHEALQALEQPMGYSPHASTAGLGGVGGVGGHPSLCTPLGSRQDGPFPSC